MDDIDSIEENNQFRINSINKEFSDRHSQIFSQLAKLEQSVQSNLKKNLAEDISETEISPIQPLLKTVSKRKFSETKHLRGKESIFKRPEAPINRCLLRRIEPDFKVNPQKWKKYTLEDVTQEDVSNRQNTASALSFLRELEERKQVDVNNESTGNEKVVFKKTDFKPSFKTSALISKPSTDVENPDKPLFKSSVLVMPEYIVGHRKKSSKKAKSKNSTENRKELKLDHLLEYEDDS